MKSKVKFGLGDNNREVIEASVTMRDSDDVRDKIAVGFKEKMGYESSLCFLQFLPSESGATDFRIYPTASEERDRSGPSPFLDTKELVSKLSNNQKWQLFKELSCWHDKQPKVSYEQAKGCCEDKKDNGLQNS